MINFRGKNRCRFLQKNTYLLILNKMEAVTKNVANQICQRLFNFFSRVGHDDQKLIAGKLKNLIDIDIGPPLHSLVIPGKMHEIEQNAFDYLKIE